MKQLEFTPEQSKEILSFLFTVPSEVFNYYIENTHKIAPSTRKVFIDTLITTHYASNLLYFYENNVSYNKEIYNELTKEQIDTCCQYVSFTDIDEYLVFKRITQEQKDIIFSRAVKSKDGLRQLSYSRTYKDLKPEQRKRVLTGLLSWTLKDEIFRRRYSECVKLEETLEKGVKKYQGKETEEF